MHIISDNQLYLLHSDPVRVTPEPAMVLRFCRRIAARWQAVQHARAAEIVAAAGHSGVVADFDAARRQKR